ncbi:MAG: transcription termination/antitermination NusG family protein [Acidobacteriota bacterium]
MECSNEKWFALQVSSRREAQVASQIRAKGYTEFCPSYVDRELSRGKHDQILPLFPGYVFCRMDMHKRILPVLTTPGVFGIVSAGRTPLSLDDSEIDAIQKAVASGRIEPYPQLAVGQAVEMIRGPLAGCEGQIVRVKNSWRLVISVTLLQRSVAVEVNREWARPVRKLPVQPSFGLIAARAC